MKRASVMKCGVCVRVELVYTSLCALSLSHSYSLSLSHSLSLSLSLTLTLSLPPSTSLLLRSSLCPPLCFSQYTTHVCKHLLAKYAVTDLTPKYNFKDNCTKRCTMERGAQTANSVLHHLKHTHPVFKHR